LADHWMVAPHPEHPEAGQEVGVPVAVTVPEVAALALLVDLVEPDHVQHARQLRFEVLVLQLIALAGPLGQERGQVEIHSLPAHILPAHVTGCAELPGQLMTCSGLAPIAVSPASRRRERGGAGWSGSHSPSTCASSPA